MNYLSEKIEELDHSIFLCKFDLPLQVTSEEEIQELKLELQMLTNILDKLTKNNTL